MRSLIGMTTFVPSTVRLMIEALVAEGALVRSSSGMDVLMDLEVSFGRE